MNTDKTKFKDKISSSLIATGFETLESGLAHEWTVQCYRNNKLLWQDKFKNILVNTGLDDVLDKYWKGAAYTATHSVGLISGTPTIVATDTITTHAGWTEVTTYTEATRGALTLGAVSAQSVNNSASKAVFTLSANATIGGIMITTDSTKGGTTGLLIAAGAFAAGDRALLTNDVLNVQVTINASSV